MVYNLTIDQGNTAAKVALWNCEDPCAHGNRLDVNALSSSAPDSAGTPESLGLPVPVTERCYREFRVEDVRSLCSEFSIRTAIYCSVSHRPGDVLAELRARCGKLIDFSVDTPTPIAVDYCTPRTLGVDRLAAAVGAHSLSLSRGRDVFVVDVGTAITFDMVTADNRYVGGNIAAGIFMRLRALNHYTARLPLVETDGDTPLWGCDTESALRSGAIRGVVAELEYYRSRLPLDAVTVITGGAADLVTGRLSFTPVVVPNLVSIGLETIIRYNDSLCQK